jgi:hypothetical protein
MVGEDYVYFGRTSDLSVACIGPRRLFDSADVGNGDIYVQLIDASVH